ncbi:MULTISPECIES: TrbI/VirB10 family protein [Actibacterium]|uniref:Type IV secretion system protein VirB10 n=1 Tax=Actibacterium naphthalenivorans TaxID=1614693 RepID=A0A840CQC1_9RHOB|nr:MULTISPECIES: TrbI/VirB10 family protein [Actibacterium]ALG90029.1 conjugal transfer protein TraI [Actibacterium sp. EMB200-NS6]MBB4024117.1 type IV secretion system protein VirB10 [Actibacterium naphthalenivorans]
MSETSTETAAAMRLRADPPRVTRISRKVIIGLGVVAGLGIGAALIYGLQRPDRTATPVELITTDRRQPADGLRDLPGSYDAIPRLGPPLPGDLGGGILDAQRRGQPVAAPNLAPPTMDPAEQQRLADLEAARVSDLFFQTRPGAPASTGFQMPPAAPGRGLAATPETDPRQAFLTAPTDRRMVAPDRVQRPASPWLLQAGSVIPAALITGIRSDLPGQITAQVTQNVYDSPTGSLLLIPQGTRLIGAYDDSVTVGQRRVLLVWNRLIFPDGRSLVLERQPGADAAGFAGLEDRVDNHWGSILRAAGLSTLLAVGAELSLDEEDRLARALRDGALDTINEAGQRIVQRQLEVPPTLTIRPGFPVRVIVTRDLVFAPSGG